MSEERIALQENEFLILDAWVENLEKTGVVAEIEPSFLKKYFEVHGADFDISPEALESLEGYSNKAKAEGMRAVWGERFGEYKDWTKEWIEEYERKEGKTLPTLPIIRNGQKVKYSGMLQFFGELTSLAAGALEFKDFKRYVETRVSNGRIWAENQGKEEDQKKERARIKVPTQKGLEEKRPASIPPGFPTAAWEKIKSW